MMNASGFRKDRRFFDSRKHMRFGSLCGLGHYALCAPNARETVTGKINKIYRPKDQEVFGATPIPKLNGPLDEYKGG